MQITSHANKIKVFHNSKVSCSLSSSKIASWSSDPNGINLDVTIFFALLKSIIGETCDF